MSLTRGTYYANAIRGATADYLLVLSEEDWNTTIPDGIAVPIFDRGAEQQPSLMLVRVTGTLFADCTKVQTVDRENWGEQGGVCPADILEDVENGVRAFLNINQLRGRRRCAAAKAPPTAANWWPNQGMVRYGPGPDIEDKMYGVLSEDAWNEIGPSWTAVRLTSKTKGWRARWEVPVTGGWVVSGDLYTLAKGTLDATPPAAPRPTTLSGDELADIADRVALVLEL